MIRCPSLHRQRRGFTLVELMLVIGIIGVIASGVIVAINPRLQLESAQNAKRRSYVREQEKAVMMYMIDKTKTPAANIPTEFSAALPICHPSVTNAQCVNLDPLAPDFLVSLPIDTSQTDPMFTGYRIYQDNALRARVCNDFLPAGDTDACAGNATASISSASSASNGEGCLWWDPPPCPQHSSSSSSSSTFSASSAATASSVATASSTATASSMATASSSSTATISSAATTSSTATTSSAASSSATVSSVTATGNCSDGIDNDGDGLIDAADPGCHLDNNAANAFSYDPTDSVEATCCSLSSSAGSTSTSMPPMSSPQATSSTATSSSVPPPASSAASASSTALAKCNDGVDNDGDGLIDAADPGCHTDGIVGNSNTYEPFGDDERTACSDGFDNDGDGLIDAADPGCHTDGNASNSLSYNPMDDIE